MDLFLQTTIAVIWDFDKTLIPGYMQDPLFKKYSVDGASFWDEVNALPEFYSKQGLELISHDTLYLNHIINYVKHGVFKGLNNSLLRELGREIQFYPGLPDFFKKLRDQVKTIQEYSVYGIEVEHYIVSTGLRQMILGSKIKDYIDGVWACEFIESPAPPKYLSSAPISDRKELEISEIGYVIDNTSKSRAIFEINKGTNKIKDIQVNSFVKPEDRRVPIENMIYIADGPSDIPVFSIVNQYGGKTFAVYQPSNKKEFEQVNRLQKQNRIQAFGPADYTSNSEMYMIIESAVDDIAKKIANNKNMAMKAKTGQPPTHLT
jgi:hypothetical protein